MEKPREYILGLDLGAKSIGWAAVALKGRKPCGLIAAGVRVFDAGMEGDIASGNAESRNAERRDARQLRRQTDRRRRRIKNVFRILQEARLLPPGKPREVLEVKKGEIPSSLAHVFPYRLRARALDEKLEPYELGRALYHLAHRRGFLSNRKARKKDEDEGVVKKGIAELDEKMRSAGARTLGEYFAGLDPQTERIRNRYTSRAQYELEFEAIWDAQQKHYPALLTDELKNRLGKAIFYQRPLKSVAGLIGRCALEEDRRRAPWAICAAQRFRMHQMVLNTRLIFDGRETPLSDDQRSKLIEKLEHDGDLTFAKAKKALGFKSKDVSFNWEEGGEKRFTGNRTNAKLAAVFGERWWNMPEDDRNRIVEDLLTFEKEEPLIRRGMKKWGLSRDAAEKFAALELERGYCNLSRKAIEKLLPHMETGLSYPEAVIKVYGRFNREREKCAELPLVDDAMPALRNPVVHRILTELRKVVNALVREYGRPTKIRIELARDVKHSRKRRREITKRNRANETARKKAAELIAHEMNIANPSRDEVLKVLLADECCWTCPYTGKQISMDALFGANPQFDIEHIIPFSRSLDNSFFNKTLCHNEENRRVKGNRTPWEAYGSDPARFEEILERVRRFKGGAAREKLRRFLIEDIEDIDEFASRQLNDTRYASRLAMEYLGLLYGGLTDEDGNRRVEAGRGAVTALLRAGWDLNRILSRDGSKSRDDHRHHAVDAVVIALTEPGSIKMVSDAARSWSGAKVKLFDRLKEPWPGFWHNVFDAVAGMNVSRRPVRKASGALHEETYYSKFKKDADGRDCVHIRKSVVDAARNPKLIVDDKVREAVCRKLEEVGGNPKLLEMAGHEPFLESKGRRIPIRRVRMRCYQLPFTIGKGARERRVFPGANHHMELFAVLDAQGNQTAWEARMVSRFEAARRVRERKPLVDRDGGPDRKFLFSLSSGDLVEMDDKNGERALFAVRTVTERQKSGIAIEFSRATDARLKKDIIKTGDWFAKTPNKLRELHCQKVIVDPLGRVRRCNA